MAKANDCKTHFTFLCPSKDGDGMRIRAVFDHLSGRLDLCPDVANFDGRMPLAKLDAASEFCTEHEGNYFYLRDVRDALKGAGVDASQLPY